MKRKELGRKKAALLTLLLTLCIPFTALSAEIPAVLGVENVTQSASEPVSASLLPPEISLYAVDFYDHQGKLLCSVFLQEGTPIDDPLLYPAPEGATFSHWYNPVVDTEPFVFGMPATENLALWPYYIWHEQAQAAEAPETHIQALETIELMPVPESAESVAQQILHDDSATYLPEDGAPMSFVPENILNAETFEVVSSADVQEVWMSIVESAEQAQSIPQPAIAYAPESITLLDTGTDTQSLVGIVSSADSLTPQVVVLPKEDVAEPETIGIVPLDTVETVADTPAAASVVATPVFQDAGPADVAITIYANVNGAVAYGDTIEMSAMALGYEGDTANLCWQYSDGDAWQDTGTSGLTYSFVLNEQNYHWAWRLAEKGA